MEVGDVVEDNGGGTIEWLLPVGWSWAKTGVTGEYGGRGGVPGRGMLLVLAGLLVLLVL